MLTNVTKDTNFEIIYFLNTLYICKCYKKNKRLLKDVTVSKQRNRSKTSKNVCREGDCKP